MLIQYVGTGPWERIGWYTGTGPWERFGWYTGTGPWERFGWYIGTGPLERFGWLCVLTESFSLWSNTHWVKSVAFYCT